MKLCAVSDRSLDVVTDVTPYDPHSSFERSNYHPHFAEEISEVQSTTSCWDSGRARNQVLG